VTDDRGFELDRAKKQALESITGDSLADRYERMAIEASTDPAADHHQDSSRPQRGGENSGRVLATESGIEVRSENPITASPAAYFFDTEFHWDGAGIRLISIAVISGDGREIYAHADHYDPVAASQDPFLAQHVLPSVANIPQCSIRDLRSDLSTFFTPRPTQLWADFGAWDQVALMQIWGGIADQPPWLPMQVRDVRQFASLLGKQLPDYPPGRHDALIDARHVRAMVAEIEPDLRRVAQMCRSW